MVVLNYTGGEINAKIVYYGPGVSGKTTNLEFIHEKTPANAKGKMVSMKTQTDRTLFFDFLPLELGEINGYRTRFLLYTVPGQVYYNATRKLVLKGADAIVFVADSARNKLDENLESLRNLEQNLNEHGMTLDEIPWVIQYNKRDLADVVPVAELDARLNPLKKPSFEAVANKGTGVYETFHGIATMVYRVLKDRLEKGELSTEAGAAAPSHLAEVAPPKAAPAMDAPSAPHTALGDALRAVMAPKAPKAPSTPAPAPAPPPVAAPPARPNPPAADAHEFEFDDQVDLVLREVEHEPQPHPVTPVPPSPSSRPAAPAPRRAASPAGGETPADEGLFAAIPDAPFDMELGRLPELDEASLASESAREEGPDEFVTDPMRHVKPKAPAKAPAPPAAKAPEPRAQTAGAVATEPAPEPRVAPEPRAPETRAPEPRVAKQPVAPAPAPAPAPVASAPVAPVPAAAPAPVPSRASAPEPRVQAPVRAPVDAPVAPSLQSTQEVREVRVAVPLVLTRAQLEGGAPIRVVLDIKIVD